MDDDYSVQLIPDEEGGRTNVTDEFHVEIRKNGSRCEREEHVADGRSKYAAPKKFYYILTVFGVASIVILVFIFVGLVKLNKLQAIHEAGQSRTSHGLTLFQNVSLQLEEEQVILEQLELQGTGSSNETLKPQPANVSPNKNASGLTVSQNVSLILEEEQAILEQHEFPATGSGNGTTKPETTPVHPGANTTENKSFNKKGSPDEKSIETRTETSNPTVTDNKNEDEANKTINNKTIDNKDRTVDNKSIIKNNSTYYTPSTETKESTQDNKSINKSKFADKEGDSKNKMADNKTVSTENDTSDNKNSTLDNTSFNHVNSTTEKPIASYNETSESKKNDNKISTSSSRPGKYGNETSNVEASANKTETSESKPIDNKNITSGNVKLIVPVARNEMVKKDLIESKMDAIDANFRLQVNCPLTWVNVTIGNESYIEDKVSHTYMDTFFVIRARHLDAIVPGEGSSSLNAASIDFADKFVAKRQYKALTAPSKCVKWKKPDYFGHFPANAIPGGLESKTEEVLFICFTLDNGLPYFGWTKENKADCHYASSMRDSKSKTFLVLTAIPQASDLA